MLQMSLYRYMKSYKKTLLNIGSAVLLQIITIICGFVITKLTIVTYGSDVNGLIASITRFLAFITLLESGFPLVIRALFYKPIAENDKESIAKILKTSENFFRKIAIIFIIYIVILCFILPKVVSNEFDKSFTISLIVIIAISTFQEYYFGLSYSLLLQAYHKKYIYHNIQIITVLLNAIVTIILIYCKCNIQTVKLASSFIFILRPIIQNIYVKKKFRINLKNVESDYKIEKKWDGLAQYISTVINNNTDVVLITLCSTVTEVSVYALYSVIINSVKNLIQSFANGIDTTYGDMIAKNKQEALNKSFKKFRKFYYLIATIAFLLTAVLIMPFIFFYTKGISDANYIRPIFALIMIVAQYIEVLKKPYFDLVLAKGDFKQTKNGAWIESILNIVISFILVWYWGIIGVAIGTLISVSIRTVEIVHYTSKNILKVGVKV